MNKILTPFISVYTAASSVSLTRCRMDALTDCIAQVFDNGLCFETTSLIAQIRGSFWMLLAGSHQQLKPHCDHSGAVIFLG